MVFCSGCRHYSDEHIWSILKCDSSGARSIPSCNTRQVHAHFTVSNFNMKPETTPYGALLDGPSSPHVDRNGSRISRSHIRHCKVVGGGMGKMELG